MQPILALCFLPLAFLSVTGLLSPGDDGKGGNGGPPVERINDVLRKILSRGNRPYTRRLLDNEGPGERISEVNKPYKKRLLGLKELHTSVHERGGSSMQAILKYIMANYGVGDNGTAFNTRVKTALKRGVKNGEPRKGCKNSNRIFFSAMYPTNVTSITTNSEYEVLRFPNVITNEGLAFSGSNGTFTCPEHGFYYFNFGYLSMEKAKVHVALMRNGSPVAWAYTPEDYKYNSADRSTIIPLEEGDTVQVAVKEAYRKIYCHLYTSFTGMKMQ